MDRRKDRRTAWQSDRQKDNLTIRRKYRMTNKPTERQTYRRTDRKKPYIQTEGEVGSKKFRLEPEIFSIVLAPLYIIIKIMDNIFWSGQNQSHSTREKVLFWPYLSFDYKKVIWWVGWGWKVTAVSVYVHFLTFRHTDIKLTQGLTIKI